MLVFLLNLKRTLLKQSNKTNSSAIKGLIFSYSRPYIKCQNPFDSKQVEVKSL